jgi:hypothetical protein
MTGSEPFADLQQQLVVAWVMQHVSRCSWERFLQVLGCPLNTVSLKGSYDPVIFGNALTAAIFNEGVIDALSAQFALRDDGAGAC